MKKEMVAKKLFFALLIAAVCIAFYATTDVRAEDTSVGPVFQLLQDKGKPSDVNFGILGTPGLYYRVYYSPTDEEGSYYILPDGMGAIGKKGIATKTLELADLDEPLVYLMVFVSDTVDFTGEVYTIASAMEFMMDEAEMVTRGRYRRSVKTWGTCAVRGKIPEIPEEFKSRD